MKGRREQSGETLVEILVSTALLGIIGLGIIGAIASVLISTEIDRTTSQAETVIRSYAAALQRAPYEPCPDAAYSGVTVEHPSKYTPKIVSVRAWDGGSGLKVVPPVDPPARQSATTSFAAGCAVDTGLQAIELEVAATSGGRPDGRAVLTVYKRDPAFRTTPSST